MISYLLLIEYRIESSFKTECECGVEEMCHIWADDFFLKSLFCCCCGMKGMLSHTARCITRFESFNIDKGLQLFWGKKAVSID